MTCASGYDSLQVYQVIFIIVNSKHFFTIQHLMISCTHTHTHTAITVINVYVFKLMSLSLFFLSLLLLSLSLFLSFSPSPLSPPAVDRVLPNIRSYLCQVLKQEKLSLEAEALRARYEAMLMSLEKATTREPPVTLQAPPTTARVNLRHSMYTSENGRHKGK